MFCVIAGVRSGDKPTKVGNIENNSDEVLNSSTNTTAKKLYLKLEKLLN